MNDIKLTDNQRAVLEYYNSATAGEGIWFDTLAGELAQYGVLKDRTTATRILNQLISKNILSVDTTIEEGSSWITLSLPGKDLVEELFPEEEEDLLGDTGAIQIVPPAKAPEDVQVDVIEGTPADEVADALQELYAQESEGDIDKVTQEQVITHTENYTINEWKDADDTEWTEIVFADGSRTLKRRRLVSDAWRTDYWGAEFSGDKERATTAKLAKMARAYGHFTHTPHAA